MLKRAALGKHNHVAVAKRSLRKADAQEGEHVGESRTGSVAKFFFNFPILKFLICSSNFF